jgi:transcriptional regulator with XRE-family HTH domain
MKDNPQPDREMPAADPQQVFEFGLFVRDRRQALGMGLRTLAHLMRVSPSYICDIEQGRRYPPNNKLDELASVLGFQGAALSEYYDKAARSRGDIVPHDIGRFIMGKDWVRTALREAEAGNLTDTDWEEVIMLIRSKAKPSA